MRILIDTNIWISGLIGKSMRNRLNVIIGITDISIIGAARLIKEIEDTAARPKFAKYVTPEFAAAYIQIIQNRIDLITPESTLQICRDPADDYLLAICQDGDADFFITGDSDLLVLDPFGKTRIHTLTDFEEILIGRAQ